MSKKQWVAAFAALSLGVAAAAADAADGAHGGGAGHEGAGGKSAEHMGSKGLANTNGPEAADRDHGLARAEDMQGKHAMKHKHGHKHHVKKSKKMTAAAEPG
ncbi:hypothetical protein DK842_20240 [Chromobacterium phragmitis]|uniref:Pentapeptide MXKDX repeat protein n=1 Tax=Chromobacterium phragmitis TaxID=2202141 RepID=A0A344UDR1_9NEIS|nr:hypothetical protein [Chromobacterium phragmitis]AXE32020.1 hypothetical protein DK842_20240 [Chromobacterium phragmitis]AXE33409.1 hypothetical protein DK843_03215 [Chromobacterium phragmitis]